MLNRDKINIYIGTNSLTFFKIYFYNLNVSTEKNCKTQTTEYDDFTGREEQLRIAPCRRCARIGKTDIKEMFYHFFNNSA